uniref:Glycosyl transferase group 1 n=1 Tax=uncultured bacterium F41-01 TaxID=1191437 RepID=I3VIP5_9BACT|nr:glycosyl transferase group 1 [uncultured bacterium F41-01]
MRFVLVGPSAPLRGGIAIENDALAHALRQAGHTVEQVSFRRLYPSFIFPGRSQFDEGQTSAGPFQARQCLDSMNPFNWLTTARTIERLRPHKVTIQWWHPFFTPSYATILAYLKRQCPEATRILISHNTRPHEPLPGQDAALRLVARLCHMIVVHARSEYDLTMKLAPKATVHIVDYPMLAAGRSLPPREEAQRRMGVAGHVLLFFGYVRHYKGVDTLLHALAQVPADLDVSLLIAGEFYEPEQQYHDLIHMLGITNRVRIHNRYISETEWPDLFAASDALVLPYRAASQSMSITLAYEFGKPVIVSRAGGLADAVEDGRTGLVTEPEPAALATTIRRFYTEFLTTDYQAAIEARRQRLGWEPFIRTLEGNR